MSEEHDDHTPEPAESTRAADSAARSATLGPWVQAAKEGDRAAFDRFFALTYDRLRLYVRLHLGKRLRSQEESLDVLQQTYLAALQGLKRFEYRSDTAALAWLCRIAENCMRALAQHHGAKKRRAPKSPVHIDRIAELASDPATGPVTRADRLEQRENLEKHLSKLPEEQRRLVLMRFFEDRTIQEMATATGRSATGVRRALGEAILALGKAAREGSLGS